MQKESVKVKSGMLARRLAGEAGFNIYDARLERRHLLL
jgi:hypothetical protein